MVLLLHPTHSRLSTTMISSVSYNQLPNCAQLRTSTSFSSKLGSASTWASARPRLAWRNLVVAAAAQPHNSRVVTGGDGKSMNGGSSTGITRQTSSTVAAPPPFPPPQPQLGSPLLWIGVGVGISIVFSWAARKVQSYAMQQALKTMMQQTGPGGNPFSAVPGGNPFSTVPGGNPFAGQNPNPFAGMPSGSFPFPPPSASTASASSTTIDIPQSEASSSQLESQVVDESKKIGKPAFTDVDLNALIKEEPKFQKQQPESNQQPKPSFADAEVVGSTGSFAGSSSFGSQADTSENGKNKSFISVEMLETMLDDPKIQKMVFPYLPEEMRDPVTFKRMIQLPPVRQQLQEALNNMGGDDGLDMLKYMNSDAVKQQFEQIGLTPEEVVGKILASPDIAASLQNPKVVEAIMDCSQNPLNITKYQNDQEVMNALLKIAELFPGATGSS